MTQLPHPSAAPRHNTRLLLISVGLAVLAVVFYNFHLEWVRREASVATFEAYTLTRSVRAGDKLTSKDYSPVPVPDRFKGALAKLQAMDAAGLAAHMGDEYIIEASQGQLLTYPMFLSERNANIDQHITKGKRLVSLPVNSKTLPGALREGMYVDIEAPFIVNSRPTVLTVMERMQVKALGTRTVYDDSGNSGSSGSRATRSFHSITIEVRPEDATHLAMIERLAVGDFDLHLRNPGDLETPKIPETGINPSVLSLLEIEPDPNVKNRATQRR